MIWFHTCGLGYFVMINWPPGRWDSQQLLVAFTVNSSIQLLVTSSNWSETELKPLRTVNLFVLNHFIDPFQRYFQYFGNMTNMSCLFAFWFSVLFLPVILTCQPPPFSSSDFGTDQLVAAIHGTAMKQILKIKVPCLWRIQKKQNFFQMTLVVGQVSGISTCWNLKGCFWRSCHPLLFF